MAAGIQGAVTGLRLRHLTGPKIIILGYPVLLTLDYCFDLVLSCLRIRAISVLFILGLDICHATCRVLHVSSQSAFIMADATASATPGVSRPFGTISTSNMNGLIAIITTLSLTFVFVSLFIRVYVRSKSGPWKHDDNFLLSASVRLHKPLVGMLPLNNS
jgi:hypothetical protein